MKFSHSYGNNLGTMHFKWCITESITESELLRQNMIVAQSVREKIQIYHTCAMRREAMNTFGRICGVKPKFLREIYKHLTGDMSASRTANEAEVNTRVRLALDGEDTNIIVDFREIHVNEVGKKNCQCSGVNAGFSTEMNHRVVLCQTSKHICGFITFLKPHQR